MELKVLVDGEERVVTGLTENTTCQEIIYALAHSVGQIGRFSLVEQWRSSERSLAPTDRPLQLLAHWAEHAADVKFVLRHSELTQCPQSNSNMMMPSSSRPGSSMLHRPTNVAQIVQSTSASSLQSNSSQAHNTSVLSISSSHTESNLSLANADGASYSNHHRRHNRSNRPPPPTYDQVMQRRQASSADSGSQRSYNWPAGRDDLIRLIKLQDNRLSDQQRMLHNANSANGASVSPNHELSNLSKQMAQYTEHKRRLVQEIELLKRKNNQTNNTNAINSSSTNSLIRLKAHVAQLDTQLSAKNREIDELSKTIQDYQSSANDSEKIDHEIQRIEAAIVERRQRLDNLRKNHPNGDQTSSGASTSSTSPNDPVQSNQHHADAWPDHTKKPDGVWSLSFARLSDHHSHCPFWRGRGECYHNQPFMCKFCLKSCQAQCITPPVGPPSQSANRPLIPSGGQNKNGGKDYHLWCCFWAKNGECSRNAKFMCPFCQKSCGTVGCSARSYWLFKPSPNVYGC